MSTPNMSGGPVVSPSTVKPTRKKGSIGSQGNPLSPSKEPGTPPTSPTSSGSPVPKAMVPQAVAQDAKNHFVVSQAMKISPGSITVESEFTIEEALPSWPLDSNLKPNHQPLPSPPKPLPIKQQISDDVFVEVIYCGESNPMTEAAWVKHLHSGSP
jgi:hypothetical protein